MTRSSVTDGSRCSCAEKIMLTEGQVLQAHGKAHSVVVLLQLLCIPGGKTVYPRNIGRYIRLLLQCFGLFQRGQAAFYRVDQVGFDFLQISAETSPATATTRAVTTVDVPQ